MTIKIVGILDRGVANRERLHLSVLADTNLNYYVVFNTSYTVDKSTITAIPKNAYWFTDQPVKAGDAVILYTGPGETVVKNRSDGRRNHFLHWGLKNTIWNAAGDCAVVLEVSAWETSRYE